MSDASFAGCESLRGSEADGTLSSVKYSIDPSRQGAFALNDPPTGEDALVVIDPVIDHGPHSCISF